MKKTIYSTKEFVLKDLKEKHDRIGWILNYFSEVSHKLNLEELKEVDGEYCKFYNFLNDVIDKKEE